MLALLVFSGTALAAVLYILVLPVVYYFYDPKGLRKYTNFSPLSGLTDLRHCYLSACGYRSKGIYEAHKETGAPILRTGPNALSFCDIRAIHDIYGHGTRCTKDLNYVILGDTHTQLFDVVDKTDHSRKRKRLSAAFVIKNLERWEFKVARTTQRLLNAMDAHCTKPLLPGQTGPDSVDVTLNFGEWIYFYFFTIEAIKNIALSADLGMLERGCDVVTAQRMDGTLYQAPYREAQNNSALAGAVFVWDYKHFPLLAKLSKLSPKWCDVWKKGEPWGDIVHHQSAIRLQRYLAGEKLDDFFSSLMEDKQGKANNLEWGEIIAEVGAIINAGADTTSIALTNVLELLLHNPQHLHTLRQEIDSVLDEDEVTAPYEKVKNLPFLRACLDEGLRISPPTSAGLPRRTRPEGAQILGQ